MITLEARAEAAVEAPAAALFTAGEAAPERTLLDILRATARRHPNAAAVADATTTLTYRGLLAQVRKLRRTLAAQGVGRGDRVGVRVPSGTVDLYTSILAVLSAGAAYVPVDAEDPDERAELVFGEAGVCAVLGAGRELTLRGAAAPRGAARAAGAAHLAGAARAADAAHLASAARPAGPGHLAGAARQVATAGAPAQRPDRPEPGDDAWIIFTSGSTGRPKGVAVTHAAAAAFVDAEARLFLAGDGAEPIGPGDRVLAGLSVAFDASCEEMWLAWRHGACLVAAPRSLVRTGADLGPWLVEQEITVVSTVPTLAALWPPEALDEVRLLIFGGEACPPELARRLAGPDAPDGREVWNTYGPTEATVVACAARLGGDGPVRIGLPLDGWRLAVVDAAGEVLPMGEAGELVIGGAGLARYLDPERDAEKFAPLPALGWPRAYRSGDLVRAEPEGLLFLGRADEQVKLGGRRIELGEVDAALQGLPGVAGAAAAVRTTKGGNQVLVGYLVADRPAPSGAMVHPASSTGAMVHRPGSTGAVDHPAGATGPGHGLDLAAARQRLRETLPAALVPLLAVVDALPTRTSGKVDRAALPWPLPWPLPGTLPGLTGGEGAPGGLLEGTQARLGQLWEDVLGLPPAGPDADFFASGGGSLAAARLVSLVRERYPAVSVGEVYQHPTLRALAGRLDASDATQAAARTITPTPRRAGVVQALLLPPLLTVAGLRWAVALAALNNVLGWLGPHPWAPVVSWWWVLLGWVLAASPPGRIAVAAGSARLLLRGLRPGSYPRGGSVHLRLWTAQRLAELSGATSLAGVWLTWYARALGVQLGPDVDLHSLPPVTGMLRIGRGAAVEPDVDLSGHWLDGDVLHVGRVRIGAGAIVGSRSTLLPGARIGKRAEVAPGSGVLGQVPAGQRYSGVPATRDGKAARRWPASRPPRSRRWTAVYGLTSLALSLLPVLAVVPGLLLLGLAVRGDATLGAALTHALAAVPLATVALLLTYALLVLAGVRALGVGLHEGYHPVHGRVAWRAWTTERLMGMARVGLFPLYASLITPVWLRALGMRVGRRVEASTLLALPSMTTVGDGAFLADDTTVASYELGGGWLRIAAARIGKRAFLGNSGMTAPGRSVPNRGLVGVLSATPKRAKAGSSWLGMPPMKLPRTAEQGDASRTFDPPRRLLVARTAVELCRVLPVMCTVALAVLAIAAFELVAARLGAGVAALSGGLVLLAGGLAACAAAVAAKWLLVGRFRVTQRPLWSAFVWRNELADTFVEVLAAPWLAGSIGGTPLMNWWLRAMGARVGRGVWCETYWLPEADLVRIGDGATVNRGCVVQTHLFHDRIMRMDEVRLHAGSTLGPHGIVLPGAELGSRATVGPASLVMSGESVPAGTRWLGNPIATWPARQGTPAR